MLRKVLVAEDNASIRRLLVRILSGPGRDLVITHDGTAALAAWARGGYDLVLLDFMMPGRTGIEVARHIRSTDSSTPVILMSGTLDEAVRRAAAALGGVECVSKPFTLEEIREPVERVLGPTFRRPDIRLGSLALQRRFLTPAQLKTALAVQSREASSGAPRRIGHICLEQGFLRQDQVDALLLEQKALLGGG